MRTDRAELRHVLVEWYQPNLMAESLDDCVARLAGRAASMSQTGAPIRLLVTVAVPNDEIVLAIFESVSAEAVAEVCQLAGVPAQRLTAAVDTRFSTEIL